MEMYTLREDATSPWWLVLLEGIFAAIFGFLILLAPGATLAVLVQFFGFYLLIAGILRIVSIFIDSSLWGWKLVAGILCIIAGIVVLQDPLLSTIVVPTYIVLTVGLVAAVAGILGLGQAFQGGGWGVGLLGILVAVFGVILLLNPLIGVVALPFLLGGCMLVGGIAAIVASFRMRTSPASTEA